MFNPYQSDNFTFENQISETALTQALSFSLDADLRTLYSPLTISAGVESSTVNPPSSALAAQTQFIPLDIDAPTAETTSGLTYFFNNALVLNGVFNSGDSITSGASFSNSWVAFGAANDGLDDVTELLVGGVNIGTPPTLEFTTLLTDAGSIEGFSFIFAGQTYFFAETDQGLDPLAAVSSITGGTVSTATVSNFQLSNLTFLHNAFRFTGEVFAEEFSRSSGSSVFVNSGATTITIQDYDSNIVSTGSDFEQNIFSDFQGRNDIPDAIEQGTVTVSTAGGLVSGLSAVRIETGIGLTDYFYYAIDPTDLAANDISVADIIGIGTFTVGTHAITDWTALGLQVEALTYLDSDGDDTATGTDLGDFFTDNGGDDSFDGGNGNDIFIGGAGADNYTGGSGSDILDYSASTAAIEVRADGVTAGIGGFAEGDIIAADVEDIIGTNFNDTIYAPDNTFSDVFGGDGNDTLFLGDRNGELFGEDGNDTLVIDADYIGFFEQTLRRLDGGDGFDTLRVQAASNETFRLEGTLVSIERLDFDSLAADVDLTAFFDEDNDGFITSGESFQIRGDNTAGATEAIIIDMSQSTSFDQFDSDTVDLSGLTFTNWGGQGETITILGDIDEASFITGSSQNDIIVSGGVDDVLDGGSGGNDTVSYINAIAAVTVDLSITIAQDTLGAGIDTLANFDNLTGSDFDDILLGDAQANIISGGEGNDTIDGRGGIDTADYSFAFSGQTVNLSTGQAFETSLGFQGETLSNIENLILGSGNDIITGNSQANVINGGAGNDVIDGGSGEDTLIGGAGDDFLLGGFGEDNYDGGEGRDTVSLSHSSADWTIDLVAGTASALSQVETLISIENVEGSNGSDTIIGDAGDNILSGLNGADVINGGDGDDMIDGGSGNDTLNGGDGDDFLLGGFGEDSYDGGSGNDTVSLSHSTENWTINLIAGTASALGQVETLVSIENVEGSFGNDVITGDAGNNILSGLDGDDIFNGGNGNDNFIGGDGDDTIVFTGNFAGYSLTQLSGGNIQITDMVGTDGTDIFSSIEFLQFADQTIAVSSLVFLNDIFGTSADDTIGGTVEGDRIAAFEGDDTINAGFGNDTLIGGLGADILNGDGGIDTADYSGSAEGVVVFAGGRAGRNGDAEGDVLSSIENFEGSDFNDQFRLDSDTADVNIINAGDGNDRIRNLDGSSGDVLSGDAGDDNIFGGAGDETLNGGDGEDNLFGNGGDDVLDGGADRDVIFGGSGSDMIFGGSGLDRLDGNSGDDTIFGGDDRDNINGGSGADMLFGEAGNDVLDGGNGSGDILDGGTGNDRLTGGIGNDTFIFSAGYETDRIDDFNNGAGDVVDISDFGIADFAALQALMVQTANDVRIDFGDGDVLIFTGLTTADLDANDFVF